MSAVTKLVRKSALPDDVLDELDQIQAQLLLAQATCSTVQTVLDDYADPRTVFEPLPLLLAEHVEKTLKQAGDRLQRLKEL